MGDKFRDKGYGKYRGAPVSGPASSPETWRKLAEAEVKRLQAEVKRLHKIERLVRQYINAPGQERGGVYRLLVWTMEGDPRADLTAKEED